MVNIQAIGYLAKDCKVTYHNEQCCISFSISHHYNLKGEKMTQWFTCQYWRPVANEKLAEYLTKGTQVYVAGLPDLFTFEGSDGKVRTIFQIKVRELELLSSNKYELAK